MTPTADGQIVSTATPILLTTEEAFEKFLRLSVADGAAGARTLRLYREGFGAFLGWCGAAGRGPREATFDDIQDYRKSLITMGFKRSTIKLRLVAVRALYMALQRWGIRPDNPAAGVKTPRDKEAGSANSVLRKALSPEEARRFLQALPSTWAPQDIRDATICRLMLFHGLRAAEVADLNCDALDYQSFTSLKVVGKGGKERVIVLCAETRKDLIAWTSAVKHPQFTTITLLDITGKPAVRHGVAITERQPAPLFFGFDKPGMNRLSVRAIERIVDRYLAAAGLKQKGRCAHALRHTAAVLAVLGGAEREAIAEAFGHASLQTTEVYTRAAAQFQSNPADAVSRTLAEGQF